MNKTTPAYSLTLLHTSACGYDAARALPVPDISTARALARHWNNGRYTVWASGGGRVFPLCWVD